MMVSEMGVFEAYILVFNLEKSLVVSATLPEPGMQYRSAP